MVQINLLTNGEKGMKKFTVLLGLLAVAMLVSTSLFAAPDIGEHTVNLRFDQGKLFTEQSDNCIGNKNGEIVIVDFFDYNCPDCRAVSKYLTEFVQNKDNSNVKVVFVDYPKLGPSSTFDAKAALAAIEQNKYPELHNAIINNPADLTETQVYDLAQKAGLDMDTFKASINSDAISSALLNNIISGTQLNVKYVPTLFITKLNKITTKDGKELYSEPTNALWILENTHEETIKALNAEVKKLNTNSTSTKTADELKPIELTTSMSNLFMDTGANTIGNKDGSIVIIEFGDYNCSDCKYISQYLESVTALNKNVKVVYVDYPILGDSSTMAAKAATAALEQGKYINFHKAMMSSTARRLSQTEIIALAEKSGVNTKLMQEAMESNQVKDKLFENIKLAKQMNVPFVPIILIANLNKVDGSLVPPKKAVMVTTDAHLKVKDAIQAELAE